MSGYHGDNSDKDQTDHESLNSNSPLLKDNSDLFSFPDIVQRFIGNKRSNSESMITKAREKVKMILKGVSLYFNPGQLIAIMGPSGKNISSASLCVV